MTEQKLKEFIKTRTNNILVEKDKFVLYIPITSISALTWVVGMEYLFKPGLKVSVNHIHQVGVDMLPACKHFGINHLNFLEND